MKTLLLIMLCLGCLLTSTFAQYQTDIEERILRGAVKKVETFYLMPETKNGKTIIVSKPDTAISFNKQGWMTEFNSSVGSDYAYKTVFFHDYQGRRILSQQSGQTGFPYNYEYVYDKFGRIKEQIAYSEAELRNGKKVRRTIFKNLLNYDNEGNVIEIKGYDSDSETPSKRHIYKFDDKNIRIGEEVYGRNEKLESKSIWSYNSKGQIAEMSGQVDGIQYGKRIYKYDAQGRILVSEDVPNQEIKNSTKTVTTYDYANLIEDERQYFDDVLYLKIVKKVDQYGNVLSKTQTYTDEAKKMFSQTPSDSLFQAGAVAISLGMFDREMFQYEYDAKGNWIKRTEFQATEFIVGEDNRNAELKPVRTQTRVITYFE